jgi:hypothetical protein
MGASFSTTEYREQIIKLQTELLGQDQMQQLSDFVGQSDEFWNVFSATSLEDFRRIRDDKGDNLSFLFSYVSDTGQ